MIGFIVFWVMAKSELDLTDKLLLEHKYDHNMLQDVNLVQRLDLHNSNSWHLFKMVISIRHLRNVSHNGASDQVSHSFECH